MPKYTTIVTCFIVFMFFISCKDNDEYRVDSDFLVYLERFEKEAEKYGYNYNFESTGLIIEYADLDDNTAGLTHYENPIRIEIDKTYWDALSKKAGADLMREDLIFHELGHGLLNRKHLNTTLENGEWKSMMCGGDKIDDRSWNINYRGVRRNYYLLELFDEKTPAPDFSSNKLLVDTLGFKSQLQLNFNSPSQAGFTLKDTLQYKTSLDLSTGRFKFESKIDKAIIYSSGTGIDIQSDFSFQLTIEFPEGDSNAQYGIVFGTMPSKSNNYPESVEYLTINNKQKFFIGNNSWYSFYTELSKSNIKIGGKNKLKINKVGQMLYYFINDEYCYSTEIEATNPGNNFGFLIPPMGVIYIDDFKIAQKSKSLVPNLNKQIKQLNFESTISTTLNQHQILKK